jgi:hypothetical protein
MIMGGRFLQSEVSSEFMGNPFSGFGIDGYDNGLKKHVGVWIDTAGTMMLQFLGECSEGGNVLKTMSEFPDPQSGENRKMKGKVTLVDDDQFTYESWNEGPDGEFFKSMEITYKRKS